MLEINNIYNMDCIEGMKLLQDNSVDILIADPPYNLSKGNNWSMNNSIKLDGFGGKWEKVMQNWDDMPLNDYLLFTLSWLKEAKRVVKPTGSLWVFGTYHNIGIINFAMQILEIEMINDVVWFKRNSFPNLSGRRLTASHESIIWAHTGGSKRIYNFNYDMSRNHDYEGDQIKKPLKQMRTVWDIPNNKKREELLYGKHPTQKVEKVIDRILRLSATENAVVLSPFCGAGTDCVVAKKLGLNYIGFELEKEYVEITETRLKHTEIIGMELKLAVENLEEKDLLKKLKKENKKLEKQLQSQSSNIEKLKKELIEVKKLNPQIKINKLEKEEVVEKTKFSEHVSKQISLDFFTEEIPKSKDIKESNEKKVVPSILKWTGSKRKQAKSIVTELPSNSTRYIEPFFGGGAVAYLAADKVDSVWGNDIYTPLIDFWNMVKQNPSKLIDEYSIEWRNLQNDFPDYFYKVRDRFNTNPNGKDLAFLTRTCVNGIVRFNSEGEFNNSLHLSRRGMKPERFANIVESWNSKMDKFHFTSVDYREVLDSTKKNDIVYLDPPYAGSNNRYIKDLDVIEFFKELEKLNSKGVKWILSFDGQRGDKNLEYPVPEELYKEKKFLSNGNSSVNNVLNGKSEEVLEALYKNFK